MRFLVFGIPILVAVAVPFSPARSESVPEALRRIDATVQELVLAGTGREANASVDLNNVDWVAVARKAIVLSRDEDGGHLMVNDRQGDARVFMYVSGDGRGAITVSDGDGRRRMWISGTGYTEYYNEQDQLSAFLGNWGDVPTGGMFLSDKDGNRRVEFGVRGDGSAYGVLNGESLSDYAEIVDIAARDGIRPGSVVAYDSAAGGLVAATTANAGRVVGVISGAGGLRPGMVIGSRADGSQDLPVAMSGLVYARVSAEGGAVEPGDLLVPSSVPGVGMRARDPATTIGSIFGKALEPWSRAAEEGLVLMLVMNR